LCLRNAEGVLHLPYGGQQHFDFSVVQFEGVGGHFRSIDPAADRPAEARLALDNAHGPQTRDLPCKAGFVDDFDDLIDVFVGFGQFL